MEEHFPVIIVTVPLFAALLVTVFWWIDKRLCFPVSIIAGTVSLVSAVCLLRKVLANGLVEYRLGGWPPPIGIAYRIDHLNSIILVAVSLVSLLNLIGTKTIAAKEFEEKLGPFYALYLLFTTGLLGILVTGDAFNLYVLLEIASLTGYALIGMGKGRAPLSGLNYLFMGTIGASLYLLGIGFLYIVTGSLNMADIAGILPSILPSNVVSLAFILCLGGLFVKMALFPLHAWLPNAYAYSPSLVASLVAPLTTKVMIYAMFRITLTVFTFDFAFNSGIAVRLPIIWLAISAIVMGSLMALSQKRLKKMLAYIVVAEVGYMVGGFWLGNKVGMSGAILHIINDVMMTLCVFMAAGAIFYKIEDDRISNLKGIFRKMPVSMTAMVVGGLSLIGVPPTCGFFSKWYLLSGGIEAGQFAFVAALIFSSLINTILFFRVFEIGFFEPFTGEEMPLAGNDIFSNKSEAIAEAPLDLLVPLVTTALLLILLGIFSGEVITNVIQFAIPEAAG